MFTIWLKLFTLFVYVWLTLFTLLVPGDRYWDEHNTDDILDLPSLDDDNNDILDSEPIDIKVEPEVNTHLTGSKQPGSESSADRKFVSKIDHDEKVGNNDDIFPKHEEEEENNGIIENEFKPEPIISNEPVSHKCTDCDESFTLINDLR